ncbi:MAG: hypothetical protein WBZ01_07085 [Terriglobales bacterium]|jgi:hypothetical protein
MKGTRATGSRLAVVLVVLAMVVVTTVSMTGQEAQVNPAKGMPSDWTHRHVVFSQPGTADEAIRNGTYERWLKITSDPRYVIQQQNRSANASGDAVERSSLSGDVSAAMRAATEPRVEPADASVELREDDEAVEMSFEEREAAQAGNRRLPSGLVSAVIPPSVEPPAAEPPPVDQSDATLWPGFLLSGPVRRWEPPKKKQHNRIKKDWSETLGNNGTTGMGEFPAVYTTGATSCTDFAVFNTGLAGTSTQANIVAYDNLYASCNGGTPTVYWAYNTGTLGGVSGDITNSVALSLDGTQVALVQFVPYPVAASGTATANTGFIPTALSTIKVGATTYTWETTANITTVNQMSTNGITLETEIAQTLYAALTGSRANCPTSNTTCIATTQTANSSVTAAVSGETVTVTASCGVGTCGNTVVFTQSSNATGMNLSPTTGDLGGGSGTAGVGGAQLVMLKWAAGGTLTSPTTLTSNSAYPTCTAPCMISVPFSGTPTDTYSAPYVSYGPVGKPSILYVGDDAGNLHKFTNIFYASGTPAEAGSPWPVTVNANASLGSPVYDGISTNVFVGDYLSGSSSPCEPSVSETDGACGYLYSINSSGTVTKSKQLDYNLGILDSPIVDSNAGMVYVFAGDDGSANCAGSTPCAAVYQFPVGFSAPTTPTEATVGTGYEFMLSGTFDNAYFTSSAATGHLYVVGNTGPANNTLYQVSINSGVMSTTTTAGPEVSNNYSNGLYSAGLQVSEFPSGANDYIFLSVLSYGYPSACGNGTTPGTGSAGMGCVIGYNVASGTISGSTAVTGAIAEAGGTSGIVVDNGTAGAQNIYFSTLLNQTCTTSTGTGGCAIQTSQSAP